jgi:hypothetical protein
MDGHARRWWPGARYLQAGAWPELGGTIASYDSPGFVDRTPAGVVTESTGAPGSPSAAYPATDSIPDSLSGGTIDNNAVVVPSGASLVNADRVTVGPADTLVGAEASAYGPSPDPLTGIGADLGQTGAGMGHVRGPSHPNAHAGAGPEL